MFCLERCCLLCDFQIELLLHSNELFPPLCITGLPIVFAPNIVSSSEQWGLPLLEHQLKEMKFLTCRFYHSDRYHPLASRSHHVMDLTFTTRCWQFNFGVWCISSIMLAISRHWQSTLWRTTIIGWMIFSSYLLFWILV